jgi:stage V sporulation protein R
MDEVGVEEVEEFIDACLSIEDQIDIHSPFIRRRDEKSRYDFDREHEKDDSEGPPRFRAKNYMDRFINPPDRLAAAAKQL